MGAMLMETLLFVIRGTRIDRQMVIKDERLRKGQVSPFSPESHQQSPFQATQTTTTTL
jgi:hypothetical protein